MVQSATLLLSRKMKHDELQCKNACMEEDTHQRGGAYRSHNIACAHKVAVLRAGAKPMQPSPPPQASNNDSRLSVLFKVGGGGGTCSQAQPSPAPQTLNNYLRLPVLCTVEGGGGGGHMHAWSPCSPTQPSPTHPPQLAIILEDSRYYLQLGAGDGHGPPKPSPCTRQASFLLLSCPPPPPLLSSSSGRSNIP